MSVTAYTKVSQTDLQALATLANTKLSPATPYNFTSFAGVDVIGLPQLINPTPEYGAGLFTDTKLTFWLFGYKTIAGTKTYNWLPLTKAFIADTSLGNYTMTWAWLSVVGPTAPDGYLAVIIQTSGYYWKDIGSISTLTEDGSFTDWNLDVTLDADNNGFPEQNLPCGHGTWLKTLNQIHNDLFTGMDIFGGSRFTFSDDFLLSGPWLVSVAPKCYLKLNGRDIYKNIEFIYSTADSATGNDLSQETDFLNFFLTPHNGANNLIYSVDGLLNGQVIIYSPPELQSPSDWAVSTTPSTGIVYTFIPSINHPVTFAPMSAFQFDFTDVVVAEGVPIVLTVTPLAGGNVLTFQGGLSNVVLTQAAQTITPQTDTIVIHPAGKAGKSVALVNTLADVNFTDPNGGVFAFETHWRTYCNGVFKANTLPTFGIFPYVDVDLPQYNPKQLSDFDSPSSRRVAIGDEALPYTASVENRGALWPVFRNSEFTPDAQTGFPMNGSKAWKLLGTKYVNMGSSTINALPYAPSNHISLATIRTMLAGAFDVRFYTSNPAVVLLVKAGALPTLADHDAQAVGGTWLSLAASLPGFNASDTLWFAGIYNPTSGIVSTFTIGQVIIDGTAPNGTFFNTNLDSSGKPFGVQEGYSYHIQSPSIVGTNPTPIYGYCVYSLTIARQPVDNGFGQFISPSTGTSALSVSVGLMAGFGFDTAGTYQELQSFTIPAGQSSITAPVFWPVTGGAPLASPTAGIQIRAAVNFQPIVHCAFFTATASSVSGSPVIGYYNGEPFYNPNRALLFFIGGITNNPITLPLAAVNYNDLEAALNLLP